MKRFTSSRILAALAVLAVLCPQAVLADDTTMRRAWVVKDGKLIDGSEFAGAWLAPRGFLGVHTMELTSELREHFRVQKDAGVLVSKVVADGPAAKAGLRAGDIITALDGKSVDSPGDIARVIRDHKKGESVRIDYSRNGAASTAVATVVERERKEIDLREFNVHIPEMAKDFGEYFNSPEFKGRIERLKMLPDCDEMQDRVRQLESKMLALEKRLKEK